MSMSTTKCALISTLALLFAPDVPIAGTWSVGAAAEAYARPPSYASRCPNSGEYNSFNGRECYKLPCELRCGGTKSYCASLPRRVAFTLMATKSTTGDVMKKNEKYQLVWSPNFWKKMTISTASWLIIQYTLKKNPASLEKILFSHDLQTCHGQPTPMFDGFLKVVPTSVVLPLLSSSCCAIQLVINALSGWGCAGFNTYLGPIRPILLPLLLLSTWKLLPQRSLGWTFISLFLAFLPELVDIWNTNRSQHWQQKHVDDNNNLALTSSSSLFPVSAKLRLKIPTMGCVACVKKVDTSIFQCDSAANIRAETSWLTHGSAQGGMAELSISARNKEEIDDIVQEVVSAVSNAGFQCNVESLQLEV